MLAGNAPGCQAKSLLQEKSSVSRVSPAARGSGDTAGKREMGLRQQPFVPDLQRAPARARGGRGLRRLTGACERQGQERGRGARRPGRRPVTLA